MIISSSFKPLWWLRNPHLQTIWPTLAKPKSIRGRAEQFELSDGDFLELEWFDGAGELVLILHGLEGSLHSPYAIAAIEALQKEGFQVVFMHFRGCGEEPNRLDCTYHSGKTEDLQEILEYLTQAIGKPVHTVIGYSLGANLLLKWLGEQGQQNGVGQAIAVSVPFVLSDSAKRMSEGLSRLYETILLRQLRLSYHKKFAKRSAPLTVDVDDLTSFYEFDDQITAPLNGFTSAADYYTRSSCRQFLKSIQTPTLIIHAQDDPFMYPETVPTEAELSSCVTLELTKYGGHVGFIGGIFKPVRWLETRLLAFIQQENSINNDIIIKRK